MFYGLSERKTNLGVEEILFPIGNGELGPRGVIWGKKSLNLGALKFFNAKNWVYGAFGEIDLRALSRFGTEKSFIFF